MTKIITVEYLRENPTHIFVFGDNLDRKGKGGAAILRDEPNTYGFITKRHPNNGDGSFYRNCDYKNRYEVEIEKLIDTIRRNPDKLFLISKLGAGLANKYGIFEHIISPNIKKDLKEFKNVEFLW